MTDEELQRLLVLDGAPGPAVAIDAARTDEIVDAVLDAAGFGGGGGGGSGGRSGAAGSATAVKIKLAIVAGAGLAVAIALILWLVTRGAPPQVVPAVPDAAVLVDARRFAAEADIEEPTAAPSTTPATPSAGKEDAPRRRRPDTADDASDLLAAANAKRAAKEWRESDALYARVVRRAPNSLAAQTALVASGSLRLEHLGDPKGAAQRFRRALAIAPRGALAEDARWGLAEAARASRDTAAEKAALDDFLAHHAASPLAPRAKARRAELP